MAVTSPFPGEDRITFTVSLTVREILALAAAVQTRHGYLPRPSAISDLMETAESAAQKVKAASGLR